MPDPNHSIAVESAAIPVASKPIGEEMMSEITRQVALAISGAEYVYLDETQYILRVPCDAGRDLQFSQAAGSEIWEVGVFSGPPNDRELHSLDQVRIIAQNPREIAKEIIRLCAQEFSAARIA